MLICDILTKPGTPKLSLEKLESMKTLYDKIEKLYHYKSEMRSQVDKWFSETREFKS